MAVVSHWMPLLLAGAALGQNAPPLVREGVYWVRTTNGVVTAAPLTRLQVSTRASIILHGGDRDQVTYTLRQRARVRTEAEARQAFGSVMASTRSRRDLSTLVVVPTGSPRVISELEVLVPRVLTEVILETEAGGIEAYDIDGRVQAASDAGRIRLDRIRGGALTRTGGGEIRLGKIGGPVRCFSAGGSIFVESSGGETICETAGGEIVVRSAAGPVTAATEGGNIQIERAAAGVSARSAAGLIDVLQAGGAVVAETRGGSIQIGAAKGVKCETAAGAIRVKNASGPLSVSTAVGSILAELLPGTRLEDSFLVAGAGDVTVLIPSKLAVRVEARNESAGARIVSDFPEIRVRPPGFAPFRPLMAEGALNGGGPVLRINAAGGTIYLRRLK